MDEQADDPDDAVRRLEAALERIARLSGQPAPPHHNSGEPADGPPIAGDVPVEEIASRLDELIDRLRVALTRDTGAKEAG